MHDQERKLKLDRRLFQYCEQYKTKPHTLQCCLHQAKGTEVCLTCPKMVDPIKEHAKIIEQQNAV